MDIELEDNKQFISNTHRMLAFMKIVLEKNKHNVHLVCLLLISYHRTKQQAKRTAIQLTYFYIDYKALANFVYRPTSTGRATVLK